MEAIPVLISMTPLVVAGLLVWLVVRTFGQRRVDGRSDQQFDAAVAVRRFILYGLLYVTLLVAALGMVELFQELLGSDRRSNAALARALAFMIVGGPAYAGLVWHVDRRLAGDSTERRSLAWTVYLNAALLTTLIGSMIGAHEVVRSALAPSDTRRFEADGLATTLIWAALWAGHWFFRRRHGIRADLELAVGTLVGLVPLAIGLSGLLYVAGENLYDIVTDDPVTERGGPNVGSWTATAVVGGLVWVWYWIARYRTAPRTDLWYVTVVPIGALSGFVATVSMAATALYTVGVWFWGDPGSGEAVRHFDSVPATASVLLVGMAVLVHHHSFLGAESERNNPIRSYDYLLALAALITAVVGLALLLVAVLSVGRSALANNVIAGVTMVAVGTPVWLRFWAAIQRHVALDRAAELRSPLRRSYLFTIFGAGGLAVLIAVLAVLTTTLEDVLEDTFGRQTLHDNRVGLAVIGAIAGAAWYHFRIYRGERIDYRPPPPPPPPPTAAAAIPPPGAPEKRVIWVTSGSEGRSSELADASGATVVHWHRTDGEDRPPVDLEQLGHLISDRPENDLLVLVGDDGPLVIPFVPGPDRALTTY